MIPYVLNGRPTAFWRGDWYVGKGIAHARIRARVRIAAGHAKDTAAATTTNNNNNSQQQQQQEKMKSNNRNMKRSHDSLTVAAATATATTTAAAGAGNGDDNDDDNQEEFLTIEVFNTHTHAPYSSDPSDSYRVHREAQAWTLAKLLRSAAEKQGNHLVIAAGDFNMTPLSTAHRIITAHAPVRDVWRVLHPDSSLGSWAEERDALEREKGRDRYGVLGGRQDNNNNHNNNSAAPTAECNLLENGVTSNSVLNTWRWSKSEQAKLGKGGPASSSPSAAPAPGGATPDPRGKRLDYIFVNTAAREIDDGEAIGGWVVKDARVTMTTRHPDLECSLSDHFAVAATLAFHQTCLHPTSKEGLLGIRGIDTTSLAGQRWPLPPGRGSLFHRHHYQNNSSSKRRSTRTLPLQGSDDEHSNEESTAAATLETTKGHHYDIRSPMGGAFLSLQSPSPSTSQLSLPGQLQALAADYDTQLLSSLSASPSGEIAGFDVHDYDALLAGVREYVAREAAQTRWRTFHFGFWLCVTIIGYIVVWFVPTHTNKLSGVQNHAINFILLLLSSLGLAAGVLDGLMALLFFRGSEKRALKEFQWELSNARSFTLAETPGFMEDAGAPNY